MVVVGFSAFIGFSACTKDIASDLGSDDDFNWEEIGESVGWTARNNHQVVLKEDEFYLFGGHDGSVKNDVWSSSDGASWTQATSNAAWSGRFGHQVVVKGDSLYLFGGNSGGSSWLNDVWSSTDGVTWTEVSAGGAASESQWSEREEHQVILKDSNFFIFGGWGNQNNLNDVWVYK